MRRNQKKATEIKYQFEYWIISEKCYDTFIQMHKCVELPTQDITFNFEIIWMHLAYGFCLFGAGLRSGRSVRARVEMITE